MTTTHPWDGVLPSLTLDRAVKPRRHGLTMVLDHCQGLGAIQDLMELAGDCIDQVKLTFGTSVFLERGLLERKIALMTANGVDVYPGGTLFEAAVFKRVHPQYFQRAVELGFSAVEISDGTIDLPASVRADSIRRARDLGLKVFSEVGKKDPDKQPTPGQMAEQINTDLRNGAHKVILEARQSGTGVGIYDEWGRVIEPLLNEVLAGLDGIDEVLWEAPLKQQQDYFVQRFGPNVNLANIRPADTLVLEALRCGLRFETLRHYVGDGVPWEGDDA